MQDSQKHTKQEFLIERIALFSDAVFAIAITLMILDIHPPVVGRSDTSAMVWDKLAKKLPEFLGLTVSFMLIGSAWLRHHYLFTHVSRYDVGLLMVNLLLLFTIILFPFSTSFLFSSLFDGIVTKPQVFFYLVVPLFSNLLLYWMYKMVEKRYMNEPADHIYHKAVYDQGVMIFAFVLALAWILIVPLEYHAFGYVFLGVGPLLIFLKSKSNKKHPREKIIT